MACIWGNYGACDLLDVSNTDTKCRNLVRLSFADGPPHQVHEITHNLSWRTYEKDYNGWHKIQDGFNSRFSLIHINNALW